MQEHTKLELMVKKPAHPNLAFFSLCSARCTDEGPALTPYVFLACNFLFVCFFVFFGFVHFGKRDCAEPKTD